jgi:hypothetical protein
MYDNYKINNDNVGIPGFTENQPRPECVFAKGKEYMLASQWPVLVPLAL